MQTMRRLLMRWYPYLIIGMVGVASKFCHLDHKLLWVDEVYTIQHTSGIPDREYPSMVPVNEIRSARFYRDLYRLSKQDHTLHSQLKGLVASPQLNPLHYPLLMVWYRIVGDEPVHFRLFSVFAFIITLPFMFLLSKRLFDSPLAGWIAISLYAVSPYLHLFAQEARYYILWSFILVVMHYTCLQAIRYNTLTWWSAHTAVSAVSLYASPVSGIIIIGHIVFVGITRRDLLQRHGLSVLIALIAYLPWALALFARIDAITSALSWQANNQHHVAFWLPFMGQCLYLLSIFSFKMDYLSAFERTSSFSTPEAMYAMIGNLVALVLVGVSLVVLFTMTRKEIRLFLLLTIVPGLLFVSINDLVRNGMMSWWWRYLIFIAPGVILVMTNLLYKGIERGSLFYAVCYLGLVFVGLGSISSIINARHWHIGNKMNVYTETARLISRSERPLLITDLASNSRMVDLMVVLRECRSDNIDILRASRSIDGVENSIRYKRYSDVFVLYATDELIGNLRSQFDSRLERLLNDGASSVWRIRTVEKP